MFYDKWDSATVSILQQFIQRWQHEKWCWKGEMKCSLCPLWSTKPKWSAQAVPRSALGSPMHAVFVRLFSTQPESHMCGLPCVICSTAVLEGKYCFSFLQLRWFARLITFSKDHVTGKSDKLNSSQGPPVYSERLSIKHLDHSPSRVPKVRGPFRTTTSSLEIRRNILMPWRIYLSQKPQRKI